MPDSFLCEDPDAWIDPAGVARRRRARHPGLAVEPIVLYTPLDFGAAGSHWLSDALAPAARRDLPSLSIATEATTLSLVDGGRLTAIVGPIGAPMAVSSLEAALALGAETILFFGICGSLQADLDVGDLVLVDDTIREEGTSYHYLPPDVPARADAELLAVAAASLDRAGEPVRVGTIWTTDAPYRETRRKVARLAAAGVLGVEMEVSAVYALARYRGVPALSLQVVSDQLVGEQWTGIDRATFRARCDDAILALGRIATAWGQRSAGPAPAPSAARAAD